MKTAIKHMKPLVNDYVSSFFHISFFEYAIGVNQGFLCVLYYSGESKKSI